MCNDHTNKRNMYRTAIAIMDIHTYSSVCSTQWNKKNWKVFFQCNNCTSHVKHQIIASTSNNNVHEGVCNWSLYCLCGSHTDNRNCHAPHTSASNLWRYYSVNANLTVVFAKQLHIMKCEIQSIISHCSRAIEYIAICSNVYPLLFYAPMQKTNDIQHLTGVYPCPCFKEYCLWMLAGSSRWCNSSVYRITINSSSRGARDHVTVSSTLASQGTTVSQLLLVKQHCYWKLQKSFNALITTVITFWKTFTNWI